ncbi:leucine-rich repeat-containing protein 23 [Phthorimaea operculella]|nr:leucine-rich repeat-containing protein 23 [Phthorimaea operculella]
MLKSKFSLQQKHVEEEIRPEEEGEEEKPPTLVEEEDVIEYRALNKSEVSVRLSWLGKIACGEGYSYLKATCTGLKLTDISAILCFKHLQFVNFSENFLTLEALQTVTGLPWLLLLHADKNNLASANLKKCKYLQVIIMNNNKLTTVEDVFHPELSTLEVGFNNITEIRFINRMPNIKVLDFRHNLVQNVLDLDFPNLDSLYLAGNKIKDLTGISNLLNLRVLHVRNNPIRVLNGFESNLPKLKYLNLRSCKVRTLRQIKRLRILTGLETLVLKNTPYMGGNGKEGPDTAEEEEDPELRVEVLATLPRLKRLNKSVFSPDERTEANELMAWTELTAEIGLLFLKCCKHQASVVV